MTVTRRSNGAALDLSKVGYSDLVCIEGGLNKLEPGESLAHSHPVYPAGRFCSWAEQQPPQEMRRRAVGVTADVAAEAPRVALTCRHVGAEGAT